MRAGTKSLMLLFFLCTVVTGRLWAQCGALETNVTIVFQTDQVCAPVTVAQFRITYNFLIPQDPSGIEIRYTWNDPANSSTSVKQGSGLIVSNGNRSFTADASFTYTDNDGACTITPTVSIFVNGVQCTSSIQTQTAAFWGTDDQANGEVVVTPQTYRVCFNNAVQNAVFRDASEFNCNPVVEPDHPNNLPRHVQFVYGTNHNPSATIRNLTLQDGGTRTLTNASGGLANTETRGTGGVTVTAAYFGPVEEVPFPASGPLSTSFPMSAPADPANLVGNKFEVTMYTWNFCNPWNGDPANPNYEDALVQRAHIEIIPAPVPDFETRDQDGTPTTDFCVDEPIGFINLTPGTGLSYRWEFYDDDTGTNLIHTSNGTNPTYAYRSGGVKLIRLLAENPSAQESCVEEITHTVNIAPTISAAIGVTDASDNPLVPDFCQLAVPQAFQARFHDVSTGPSAPGTVWRWEFYDRNGALFREEPGGGTFSPSKLGPFDQSFIDPGVYRVRLIIRDFASGCESRDETEVRVFESPVASFIASNACEDEAIAFTENSTLQPIDGDAIAQLEWDFAYDGTFNKDAAFDNQSSFSHTLGPPGTYSVALRAVSSAGCADTVVWPVQVHPLPAATITADTLSGCSVLAVTFTNESVDGQPANVVEYIWEVSDGTGFKVDSIQRPDDPGFTNQYTRLFTNTDTVNTTYRVRVRAVTAEGCERRSNILNITVFPGPMAGFDFIDYSPFNNNCSPLRVNFRADKQTRRQRPQEYIWRISDDKGLIAEINTDTTSAFGYTFVNDTTVAKNFYATLRTTFATGCYNDSTLTVRINPVPSSDFIIDTLEYGCDIVRIRTEALQKGLPAYHWTVAVNGDVVLSSSAMGEGFEYEIVRSMTLDKNVSITLVTTNLVNCNSPQTTHSINVMKTDDMNVGFTALPEEMTIPNTTVTITDLTRPGPWKYHWDFGDGTTSDDPDITSHTYATHGTFTITLTVANEDCAEQVTATVLIHPIPPILDFDYQPSSGCIPLTVHFTNLSQYADPTTYHWSFGENQGTSRAENPTYTYYEPGIYSVTLSATNVTGEVVTLTKEMIIEVLPQPNAAFDVKPREVSFPNGILYTSNQSIGATQYHWDFGDGTTSSEFEPQHEYKTEGVFDITLTATNDEGCSDSMKLVAGVRTVRSGRILVPNAFSPSLSGPGSSTGKNDVFRPALQQGFSEFKMMVFDRWGELLFETNDPTQGWDGYHKGKLCPQDVYIYKIEGRYSNGEPVTRVGDIHLIR